MYSKDISGKKYVHRCFVKSYGHKFYLDATSDRYLIPYGISYQ